MPIGKCQNVLQWTWRYIIWNLNIDSVDRSLKRILQFQKGTNVVLEGSFPDLVWERICICICDVADQFSHMIPHRHVIFPPS